MGRRGVYTLTPIMRRRPAWILAALLVISGAGLGAQRQTAVPRMPDGRPDLQGTWDLRTATPLERRKEFAGKPFFTPQEAADFERREAQRIAGAVAVHAPGWLDYGARLLPDLRTSLIVDPPDGRIPAMTAAAQQRAAARASARRASGLDGPEAFSIQERCLLFGAGPPLLPGPYNNTIQIVQTPTALMVYTEMIHDARIVALDGRAHRPAHLRSWLGESRGRWEGDTLVVETTHFMPDASFRGNSEVAFRGWDEHLRVVERFTRENADVLGYEVTVANPAAYTAPWTARMLMARSRELMYEYACHEGNYGLVNMLTAARSEDADK
jgi:hypothetical protein